VLADGALLVATTDPIHHGHAYDTPPADCLDAGEPSTQALARSMIDEQLTALAHHEFAHFARLTEQHKSDFRDTGPVLAALLGPGFTPTVHDLALVDYSEALHASSPSWVAGALITV
jgi:hypothetical protein